MRDGYVCACVSIGTSSTGHMWQSKDNLEYESLLSTLRQGLFVLHSTHKAIWPRASEDSLTSSQDHMAHTHANMLSFRRVVGIRTQVSRLERRCFIHEAIASACIIFIL